MPGNPLSITLPTVGITVGPTYATQVRAALEAIIDDLEAKVTPDEIVINADLSYKSSGTAYGATNLKRANFDPQSAGLAAGNGNSIYSLGGELYWQDGSGNDVAMTSSGAVAGAAGNITSTGSPAYATNGIEILWSGGDLEYRFKDGAGATAFADLVFGSAEFRNGSNALSMSAIVTTDYDIIWPAVGPDANDLVTLDASGNISFGKTLTGNFTLDGDLDASGDVKHGDKPLVINAIDGTGLTSAGAVVPPAMSGGVYAGYWQATGTGQQWVAGVPLAIGDRIKSIRFNYEGTTGGTKFFYLREVAYSGPTVDTVESTSATASTTSAKVMPLGTAKTLAAGFSYWVAFSPPASGDRLISVEITYDRP